MTTARHNDIAIIAMACRYPGENQTPEQFYQFLLAQGDGISDIPADRWDKAAYFDADKNRDGKMYVSRGGFLTNIAQFDPVFFGISPKEAPHIDPQHRWLLELNYELLQNAGLSAQQLRGSDTAVFIGQFMHDYEQLQLDSAAKTLMTSHSATGPSMTLTANRLSYCFDWHGPSVTLDTACSSSLVALDLAVKALQSGDCQMAVAGGVNILLRPELTMAICKASMLSPDGRCKSFDASANGYVRSEGVGLLLLKDLAQARADGDPVLAVIKATGVNQDGQTNGITVPNGSAQQRLVRQSLQRAGLTAAQIQYVEAHGTGTAVGDPIEVNALAAVFGGRELPEQQCVIGSVKSNIGHTEAAAGVAGVIKTVMAMRAGLIPANLHLQQVNPAIALELLKVRLAQQQMPWPDQPGEPRRALVNSFGFGGTNANVVLEQALDVPVTEAGHTELTTPLLCLSSQSRQGLKQQAGRMADYLLAVAPDDKAYLDICYSSLRLREHFRYRLCVSATAATAAAVLADVAAGTANTAVQLGESTTRYPSACWVFSGMGTTWPGMGRDLYQHNAVFRQTLQRIDQALQQYSGWSLLDTLLQQDDAELIHRTDRAQPAIFAIQAALAATLQAWGLQPGCIVGHSAGEVAAAYVAGALSFDDAIRVIYHRSQLQYSTEGSGRMLAVGLSLAELEPYLAPYQQLVAIAAVNSAQAITLSGDASALATIAGQLEQQGLFARFLNVAVPYHSPLMDPLKQPLWQALQGIQVQEPQIPLYSTVTGALSTTAEWGAEYWPDNVREPVLFQQAIQQIEQDGWQCFIEIAPHSVLASSIQKNVTAPALICSTLKRDQDGAALLQQLLVQLYLGGAELPAAALYPAAKAIYSLPNYAWQQQSYWHEAPAVQQARLYNLQAGSAAGKPQHPLLGASVAGSQILWQQQLSPVEPAYLADHQVEGQVVYPGAAYVETALALARHQLGYTQITLTQVEFFRALFLPAAQQCQFETRLDADSGSYQIWSQLPEQPWQLFSAGRLQSGSGDAPAVMALAALQARLQRHWQAEEFYQHCQRLGLDYQQSFQGVHQAWSDGGDALAEIRLPVPQAATGYLLHPIALDSAFQTLFCTIEAGYLPVAIGQLNFYQSPGAHFYAYLHTRFADAQQIHGDLYLLDPAGGVLVELLGVELKASRTEQPQASPAWSDLYQFCWQRSHWQPAVSGSSQILLCSAEPALLADALAALPDCQIEVLPWSVLQQADSLLARMQQHANSRLVVQLPATVLHAELSAAAVQQQCMDLLLPLLTLAQQSAVLDQRLQCLVLTTAAASLWPELVDNSSDPVQAAVWGFTRVWQTEQAGHQLALLDLPAQPTAADWQLAAVLCQQGAPEQELAIRQGQLYQQRYQALTSAELLRQQERSWQQTEPGHYQLQPAQSQAGQLLQLQSQPFAEHSFRLEKTVLASQHFRQFCRAEQRLLPQLAQGVDATGAGVLLACQNVLASWQPATSCQQWSIPATLIQQPLLLPSLTAYLLADDLLRHKLQLTPGQTLLIHQLQDEVGLALLLLARSRQIHLLVQCQSADWRAHCQSLDLPLMTASAVFQLRQQLQSSGTLPDAMVSQGQATELALLLPLLAPLSPLVLLDTQADSATLQQAALAQLSLHNVSSAAVLSRAITQCGQTLPGLLQQLVSGDLPLLPAQACPPLDSIMHNPGSSRHPLLQLELPLLSQVQLPPRPLVRSDRSYLISGGLGGLGLAMLDWLLAQGATELVLTSRRPPALAMVQRFASLASAGIRVHCFQGDIADATTVAALFEQLNADFKPLAGIFHAAGVLSDGTLQQQDAAKFATVLAAKVQGSWLLHQHSLALPLDFMVCFSSIAAVVGWAGQANYAAANSFMDQLMQMRRVQGLPGLSINWGPWAEAGMAAELTLQDQRRMEKAGMTAMNNADSVRLMQLLLQYQVSQAGIFRLDWRALPQVYGSQQVRTLFSALVPEQQASNDSCFLSLYQQASTVQRHSMLTVKVGSLLAEVLGLASDETPDASRSMFEFGLNSLMALDFKNKLQQLTGLKLAATLVMKYPTIHLLTAYLAEQLAQAVAAPVAPPAGVLYWSPAEPWVHLDSHWSGEIGLTATVANMIRQGQSSHFNIAGLLQIDAAHFDWQVLTDSLQMLWCRHDGCRVRLSGAPDWQQQIAPMPTLFSPDYHDFSQLTPADARQALRQVCQTLQQSFSFSLEQPLYRLACFKLAESEPYRLFICFHHFIADGRALAVLLEDFERIYRLRFQQAEVVLPDQSYRLQDWHQRIARFVANELPAQLPYWQRQLQLAAEFVLPPTVQRNAQRTASDLTAEVMWLAEPLVQQLQKFCQRHQVEMTDLGCYALGQALSPLSHSHCLWVDLVLHGRHQLFPEVEIPDLFGQISEYGSVYLHWDGKALASAAVQSCAALRRAAPNAGIGLKALHYLAGEHAGFDSSRQPKVLINFDLANYQGRAENWWQLAAEDCGDSATLVVEQEHSYSLHLKAMAVGAEIRLSLSYWRDEYDQASVQQILQRLQQQLLRAAAEGTI
jgi:acyl transferase domain-containing protein/NAD(P)-dependent dehydrogenase (short-subunit alcohol dehydrogenase family)/acyl carrier protein